MFRTVLAGVLLLLGLVPAVAQDDAPPPAPIVNDEGGPEVITGEVSYTNPFFTAGVAEPLVIMEDQTGFVERNRGYIFTPVSQVQAQITSDFFTSPFAYVLQLPLEPQGEFNDVDQDDEQETGVQIFGIAYWTNVWGPSFLEPRDQYGGGWSSAYASMSVSNRSETLGEVTGGKYLIYAPDDEQGFPSGFGDDNMLFTEDDPIVTVPAGYTLVDMDTEPFTFDRSQEPVVDLIEGEGAVADDFSNLSFTEAFDAMVEKFRNEYAFTEYKNIDWDAKIEEFRPLFEEAEASNDPAAYEFALRDFLWSIPDGHVGLPLTGNLLARFQEETAGGIGIAIRELDDGRTIVNYVTEDGPADEAGIELRAEILEINGEAIEDVVSATIPWSSPFSADDPERLQKLRYATRFLIDEEVEVTYRNPGDDEPTTVTLTAVPEPQSFTFSSFLRDVTGFELPVEFEPIEGTNYVLVKITDFLDNERLTIDLWERMITTLRAQGVPGIIIDMRSNGGGNGWLALQMAAYFYQEPHVVGNSGEYDEDTGDFFFDPNTEREMILPPENLRYDGQIAVLVGPNCNSACEFFSYYMTVEDRSAIVGQYTTGGLGGGVEQFFMPGGINVQLTVSRAVDAEGSIHLEDVGVVPTVRVPVTEETLFSEGDPVLETAIAHLDGTLSFETVDGGEIEVGDQITGSIEAGQRVHYTLTLPGDHLTSIILTAEDESLAPILNLYAPDGESLIVIGTVSEDDPATVILEELDTGGQDFDAVVEVATTRDQGSGEFTLEVVEVTEEEAEATAEATEEA